MARTKQSSRAVQQAAKSAKTAADLRNKLANKDNSSTAPTVVKHDNLFRSFAFPVPVELEAPFVPHFNMASVDCPITGQRSHFLAASFSSKFDGKGVSAFGRPNLSLCLVLDTSYSMTSPFSTGNTSTNSKLMVAKRSILAMVDQLEENDRVSLITFDTSSKIVVPPITVGKMNRAQFDAKVNAIACSGGTRFVPAMTQGVSVLKAAAATNRPNTLSRVMFLTDMCSSEENAALTIAETASANKESPVFTTIVAIGVELKENLIQRLSSMAGGRYLSVASEYELNAVVAPEFSYDVSPIAFDIRMQLGAGWQLVHGYGSPEIALVKKGDSHVRLSSEFANPTHEDGGVLGGVLLFEIEPTKQDDLTDIAINTTWNDRDNKPNSSDWRFGVSRDLIGPKQPNYFTSLAVRKAVALLRVVQAVEAFVCVPNDRAIGFRNDHRRNAEGFASLYQWLRQELAICGDSSLNGSNRYVAQLLECGAMLEGGECQGEDVTAIQLNYIIPKLPFTHVASDNASDTSHLKCRLTKQMFTDPVLAMDGFTYERSAIARVFQGQEVVKSPVTLLPISSDVLVPDKAMKRMVEDYQRVVSTLSTFSSVQGNQVAPVAQTRPPLAQASGKRKSPEPSTSLPSATPTAQAPNKRKSKPKAGRTVRSTMTTKQTSTPTTSKPRQPSKVSKANKENKAPSETAQVSKRVTRATTKAKRATRKVTKVPTKKNGTRRTLRKSTAVTRKKTKVSARRSQVVHRPSVAVGGPLTRSRLFLLNSAGL